MYLKIGIFFAQRKKKKMESKKSCGWLDFWNISHINAGMPT